MRVARFVPHASLVILLVGVLTAGCNKQSASPTGANAKAPTVAEVALGNAASRGEAEQTAEPSSPQTPNDAPPVTEETPEIPPSPQPREQPKSEPASTSEPVAPPEAPPSEAASENPADEPNAEPNAEPAEKPADEPPHPFPHRLEAPEFPRDMEWINTAGPLRLKDLKGKYVLLDFWTYCCINCMHVLPELKKLEHAYPHNLVVIGVHSAKFDAEKGTKNIEEAVQRYEIEHAVVNDDEHRIWNSYGIQSWPTMILIDPEGNAIWGKSGETKFEDVDAIIKQSLPYYAARGALDASPIRFNLAKEKLKATPLRFPGKVLADEAGNRLFISDSNHNRIVISTLDGKLLDIIGSGAIGANNGNFQQATFNHPQGMALRDDILYVADTENHLLRKVDLKKKNVSTIAGRGRQGRSAWPGAEDLGPGDTPPDRWVGKPLKTGINSPWALWLHGDDLYIAMAGPHQIWKMTLGNAEVGGAEIGPYAGNGREDIVDGPLLPRIPYREGFSSFAQPSGLASDGKTLFVADSEGSSIRAVPFDGKGEVSTIVGTAHMPYARLFTFGDVDGDGETARLQHALGVVYHAGKLYVADTYNNKIKVIDLAGPTVSTLAGTGQPGADDAAPSFDEPEGLAYAAGKLYVADTNNHVIRTVEITSGKVGTLTIAGLAPPAALEKSDQLSLSGAAQIQVDPLTVKPVEGNIRLAVALTLPEGWKINPLAPMTYQVKAGQDTGPIDRKAIGKTVRLEKPAAQFEIVLPVSGDGADALEITLNYFYCQEGGEGLCKVGVVAWSVPLTIAEAAESDAGKISFEVPVHPPRGKD